MKVSVVMPVYNGERLLPVALDSLCRQTFRDFELIVVDDGSSDRSCEVVEGYADRLNLKLIRQQNAGASVAYNRGLDAAEGEYVYMMDQDDLAHPQLLELAVGASERSGADYVVFDYSACEESELPVWQRQFSKPLADVPEERLPEDALTWFVQDGRNPGIWQFLLRRESFVARRYLPGITLEDNLFVFPFLADVKLRGFHVRADLYAYVQRPSSVMHVASARSRVDALDVTLTKLREVLTVDHYDLLVRKHYIPVVKAMYRAGSWRSRRCVAVRIRSLDVRGLMRLAWFPWRWKLKLRLFGAIAPRWIRDRRFEGFVPESEVLQAFRHAGVPVRSIGLVPKFRHGVLIYRGETETGLRFAAKFFDMSTRPGEGRAAARRLQFLEGTMACKSLFADRLTEISHYEVACFSWCEGGRIYPDKLSSEAFHAFLDGYAALSEKMQRVPEQLLGWPTEPHPTCGLKILHGDFTSNNIRFDADGRARVFDFEDMFLGYVAEDIIPYFYHALYQISPFQFRRKRKLLMRLKEAISHLKLSHTECRWVVEQMRGAVRGKGRTARRERALLDEIGSLVAIRENQV